ncbi:MULTISPECIES: alcohol dehydrogenase family protein [unclassified Pseudomonas]|uniref:alcohol dehydrogenase family protein n=1 Tax=unclassified Pseudomonas TaxID=196821 RepID=UPI0039B724B7
MISVIPESMHAVLLMGHGGPDKLQYHTDVKVPRPAKDEVLVRVAAAAVNNTDINTRIGWYSKKVSSDTQAGNAGGFAEVDNEDASWSGVPLRFPLIQGADCCGYIVAVGEGVAPTRVGQRVLIRNMLRAPVGHEQYQCWTYGSDCNGSFAQYTVAPDADTWSVDSDWSDIELASIPCSYSTAELMMQRAGVNADDIVLITGASGGVGSAAVQLAKCRGARVIAITTNSKRSQILELGADEVIDRNDNLLERLGKNSVTVVIDLVGGNAWPPLLDALKTGGRYAISGAIAGPLVELDLRTLYLKDLTFYGCTWQDDNVFQALINYIESGRIRPLVSKHYPLSDIAQAQEDFLSKKHVGKLVLVPPQETRDENS